ncbi:MAG: hypothetical protein U0R27_02110 [Candidatus Nanopelagicales bacterium]
MLVAVVGGERIAVQGVLGEVLVLPVHTEGVVVVDRHDGQFAFVTGGGGNQGGGPAPGGWR